MAETFLIFTIQEWEKKNPADCTVRQNVSQEMGGCSVTFSLFFFYQIELFVHIFKMRNADHILLLKVRVSLLPGEAAVHGSVPLCISG